jgi:protein-tyrosine phosphatase
MLIITSDRFEDRTEIYKTTGAGALWQGGRPPTGRSVKNAGFDMVVLCAEEYQPAGRLFSDVRVLHCPFDDADVPCAEELEMIHQTAKHAAMRVRMGEKVLVTCNMGINRSGLVTAITLMRLTGMSGRDATLEVRSKRSHALQNTRFTRYLAQLSARPIRA